MIEAGKLQEIKKMAPVRRWEKHPDFVGRLTGDDTPIDVADIDKFYISMRRRNYKNIR